MLRAAVTCATLLFIADAASATQPMSPGQPGFALQLTVADQPKLGEPFRIRVAAGAVRALRNAIGTVHLRIPEGMAVVEGDTVRQCHPSYIWMGTQDNEWDIWLRPTSVGRSAIRGWFRIARGTPDDWDETECVLDLDVHPDTVVVSRFSRALRFERVSSGLRLRYGWEHMVLIDGPEPGLADLPGPRTRPEVIRHPQAVCGTCELASPKVVRCVVTVGADGRVRWIEPRPAYAPPEDSRVLKAAEDAVRRWRFRPAKIAGRAIADWTEVDVAVVPESR
ncbi:MAG TPA: hypothetical protein VF363_05465 [Candidatus Eisenbacteria bacterium]